MGRLFFEARQDAEASTHLRRKCAALHSAARAKKKRVNNVKIGREGVVRGMAHGGRAGGLARV